MKSTHLWMLPILCLLTGCSGPNGMAARAPHVPYSDLRDGQAAQFATSIQAPPYVLAFKAGDEIPLHFALESKLVELVVPPLTIRTKQDFWILIRQNGPPLVSLDGKDFTTKAKNSFQFGLRVVKDEPPQVRGKIRYRAD